MYVRALSEEELNGLRAGLRSSDAFVLRRCQILLASARGQPSAQIAPGLGCSTQTVRNVIRAFHARGLACLEPGSHKPHHLPHTAFPGEKGQALRLLVGHSPREYGKDTSVWTLALAAQVSFEQGLSSRLVSAETVRATFQRLGVRWQRAKEWIESPDPHYQRKKAVATD